MDRKDYDWVLLKLDEHPGSFLEHFLKACLAADTQNWQILLPAMHLIQRKYPLKSQPLNEKTHGQ
jgi:hypothetical protein